MSQNLQKFVKFQKFQLENLVDFEKCCKTHIYLEKSVPIQPKTSNILPKILPNILPEGRSELVGAPDSAPGLGRATQRPSGLPVTSRDAANFTGLVLGCIGAKFCK